MDIEFLLNGETVRIASQPATRTLLDWLRETRKLTGTKEGCNEGDCGACTVMVTSLLEDKLQHQALNACILFLPQLHGKSVRTVEGLKGPKGELHPVQTAMVEHHGSQCGFCTPGFVMSMATAHQNGFRNHDDMLAGNLCRCTGYAPIIRAADAAAKIPTPDWLTDELDQLQAMQPAKGQDIGGAYMPQTIAELANWYADNPDATLVGGATDVGLWVTKKLASLQKICLLGQIAEMIRRYGSNQVRGAATIGGNIANGSPIGDGPPALIALGATLHLRRGAERRDLLLEDFFVDYGKQDIQPGEFVEAVSVPRQTDTLKCYKISKRFDQDISAVCGCFNIVVTDQVVKSVRIAFGGMAATPKRALLVEKALLGQPWTDATIRSAIGEFSKDFQPIDDMRASAAYRLMVARNLLTRYFAETQLGQNYTRVLEVDA